jgi:hypothetical protein
MTIRDGALPYLPIVSSIRRYDGIFPLYSVESVGVESAVAMDQNTIRISYSGEVKHASAENLDDALNPANYDFTGDVELTPASVDLVTGNPTVVDVNITGEQTTGESYSVAVSNVLTAKDEELSQSTANFVGAGVNPELSSVEVLLPRKIRVFFNELMTHNLALTTPGNFTFTGGLVAAAPLSANDVGGVTRVDVPFTGTVVHGEEYLVEAAGIIDLALNPLDTENDTGTFNGLSPEVVSAAIVAGKVRVTFNCEVKHSDDEDPLDALYATGWSVVGPDAIGVVSVALVTASPTVVDLELETEMTDGAEYTVTATCQYISGGVLEVDHAHFTGEAEVPRLSLVDFVAPDQLWFIFNEKMKNDSALNNPSSYQVSGPTFLAPSQVTVVDLPDHTRVLTYLVGSVRKRGLYTATVNGVRDLAENLIDPLHRSGDFLGELTEGKTPVWISPPGEKIFGAVEAPGVQVQEKKTEEV